MTRFVSPQAAAEAAGDQETAPRAPLAIAASGEPEPELVVEEKATPATAESDEPEPDVVAEERETAAIAEFHGRGPDVVAEERGPLAAESHVDGTPDAVDKQPAAAEIELDGPPSAVEETRPAATTDAEELDPVAEPGLVAPAAPAGAGVTVPASSMDSLTLPERSRHEADARRHRRRRSAARLPVLVAPVDIPEDAEGRVEILVVRGGADRDEPPSGGSSLGESRDDVIRHLLTLGSGWVAVGVLGAALIAVFVVFALIYR